MNGAESLVRTLVGGGVNVCFTNPGTSDMHFVAALDKVEGMRCVLALFEGVVTGAADGYYSREEWLWNKYKESLPEDERKSLEEKYGEYKNPEDDDDYWFTTDTR